MEQREFTREAPDGSTKYTIMFVLHLREPDALYPEMRRVKGALLDWHQTRGDATGSVFLLVRSDEQWHGAVEQFVALMHAQEIQLKPLFQVIPLTLVLHLDDGSVVQEKCFDPSSVLVPAPPAKKGWFQRFREWFGPGQRA